MANDEPVGDRLCLSSNAARPQCWVRVQPEIALREHYRYKCELHETSLVTKAQGEDQGNWGDGGLRITLPYVGVPNKGAGFGDVSRADIGLHFANERGKDRLARIGYILLSKSEDRKTSSLNFGGYLSRWPNIVPLDFPLDRYEELCLAKVDVARDLDIEQR